MAKKRSSTSIVRYAPPAYAKPAPIVVRVPRAMSAPKAKPRRHHKGKSSGGGIMNAILAGAAMGYIDKQGTAIPTIPVLGRAGTIAAAAYLFRSYHPFLVDLAKAAATIATYEQVKQGSIDGLAPQVNGIAAQT